MNKIILIGRTTKNIELRFTTSNKAVVNFSLAVNRNFKNEEGEYETDFINCVVYGKQAENMKQFVSKGDLLGVEGRLQIRSYQNEEGKNIYVTEVIVENVQFLATNKKEQTTPKEESDPFADFGGSVTIDDDFLD